MMKLFGFKHTSAAVEVTLSSDAGGKIIDLGNPSPSVRKVKKHYDDRSDSTLSVTGELFLHLRIGRR